MVETKESFLKNLAELRELAMKGADADPKKFNTLAKSLLWDVQSGFSLPMPAEQLEFIKILTTSESGGEYWKGYGDALTTFLLPMQRSMQQETPPVLKISQPPVKQPAAEIKLPAKKAAVLEQQSKGPDEFSPILD